MITLFAIGIIVFTAKLVYFAFKAAWGITKGVLFVIGVPAMLIVLFAVALREFDENNTPEGACVDNTCFTEFTPVYAPNTASASAAEIASISHIVVQYLANFRKIVFIISPLKFIISFIVLYGLQ